MGLSVVMDVLPFFALACAVIRVHEKVPEGIQEASLRQSIFVVCLSYCLHVLADMSLILQKGSDSLPAGLLPGPQPSRSQARFIQS